MSVQSTSSEMEIIIKGTLEERGQRIVDSCPAKPVTVAKTLCVHAKVQV